MKELKRLNYKVPYSTRPIGNSGHRFVYRRKSRCAGRYYYAVCFSKRKIPARQFKFRNDALCYKFIILLKIKSNIYINERSSSTDIPC